jgi:hypothetical protein
MDLSMLAQAGKFWSFMVGVHFQDISGFFLKTLCKFLNFLMLQSMREFLKSKLFLI